MALGLYVHVPFCERVCHYCDFAVLKAPPRLKRQYLDCIRLEAGSRSSGWGSFRTLYYGGGTPSILEMNEFEELHGMLSSVFRLNKLQEFSIEANPESLCPEKLSLWKSSGCTRISLGVQSLNDERLALAGRPHDSTMALAAMNLLAKRDMNFSVDLMFGLPGQTREEFRQGLKKVLGYAPSHLSLYGLTVEANTLFEQRVRKKCMPDILDKVYDSMYLDAVELCANAGLERYEVSNFASPGNKSLHNSGYWEKMEYLGLGPGAHSLQKEVRSHGPTHFLPWRRWTKKACPASELEIEKLDKKIALQERVWLSLRTREGLNLQNLKGDFGDVLDRKAVQKNMEKAYLQEKDGYLQLIGKGWLFLDRIAVELLP